MGILQEIGEGVKAEVTVGLLLAASFFAGCSSRQEIGNKAIDSRAAASASNDGLKDLTVPEFAGDRILFQLENEKFNRFDLNRDESYVLEVPSGKFCEVFDAVNSRNSSLHRRGSIDDSIIFKVTGTEVGQYEVVLKSFRYCNRGDWGVLDGTYVLLVDTAKDRLIESAVKFPYYGEITFSHSGQMETQSKRGGLVYLQTSDGVLHKVPELTQYKSSDSHKVPGHLRYVIGQISPIQDVPAPDIK